MYHYNAAGQLERVDSDADTLTYRRDVRAGSFRPKVRYSRPSTFVATRQ
ncbi:hypothetical protein ABXK61_24335 [Burkholderia sola]|uniref:Uncharacterized protein n=1 Tax=Burkholderia sola TaxID=2843302 RepID=A0ABV2CDL5_9BURK|nr:MULTISPECIES: hypothetical protein [unclassified Burkholderia]MBP0609250.1 hypothetical protein [Burkholderia sp. CpTa8-5]MBP0716414.1 hypothetical protein [Burkholderia sp. AcTa6-5]